MFDWTAEFASKMIGTTLNKFTKLMNCADAFKFLLGSGFSSGDVCVDSAKELQAQTLTGARFWIKLFIGKSQGDLQKLDELTGGKVTLSSVSSIFSDETSQFRK